MISVAVADDHAVVRTGLQLIFQGFGHIHLRAEASNGLELLDVLGRVAVDVAVVDVNMPGLSSIDLIVALKEAYPNLPIVVFTMNRDVQLAVRMFKNGVLAYINKEENPVELVQAIQCVVQHRRYLTKHQELLFANLFVGGQSNCIEHDSLTDREYQILCFLASGKSNTEIAEKLSISKNTLSNHRNNILRKLSLSNNVELTKYAIVHQLIQ